jgi:hypothetical protein
MLRFELTDQFKGCGISQGLDRGLLVFQDDVLLVEEGMGIGACALQTGGFTYFASTRSIRKNGDVLAMMVSLDKKLVWRIFGIKSMIFTKIFEASVSNNYMKRENDQEKLFKKGAFLRRFFHVKSDFVAVEPQGQINASFEISDDEISIGISCKTKKAGGKLFIMNELGGSCFNEGMVNQARTAPPTGWQNLTGPFELYSPRHALAFSIEERRVPENVHSRLCWGREVGTDYSWAGFECELVCDTGCFDDYRYVVKFRKVVI